MKVAFLIAVETFACSQIQPLPFAEADVAALAEVLEPLGFAAVDRVVLVNQQATKSSIESRARRVLKGLDEGDELIFYYAGHGFSQGGTNWLACCDTDPDDLAATSVELGWLLKQFHGSDCQKISFFLATGGNGIPAADERSEIAPAWDHAELEEFFHSSEHNVCLAACMPNESPHSSAALKHGIWAYHVIEAFAGRVPEALEKGVYLTPYSLQNYLTREVPRTLAKAFATKKPQTPWMAGASGGQFRLADLTTIVAQPQETADSYAGQIGSVTLLGQQSQSVRSLSGFNKKTHKVPDRVSDATASFVARIASEEIEQDIHRTFAALRSAFKFKRADLDVTNRGDGTATIITPYFNYSIAVELDREQTSKVVFRRTVDAIKEPAFIFSAAFAEVFANVFDTVELDMPSVVELDAVIDRIEELDDDRIRLDYDPDVTYCRLHVAGVAGIITVTPHTLAIVHTGPQPPQLLLQSLLAIQKLLDDQDNVPLLPFDE